MTIEELVKNTNSLDYKTLCSALIKKFGVTQPVTWESVLPHPQQQELFGGEVLRLVADHATLATQKEIRPVCLMKGDISQLLFFYVQLKDEKLPKSAIERITRKFIGGAAADRYIIWFFGNSDATKLKVVISGKEGKKIRLKTLELEAGQWFKTYDLILNEVERKFNTGGLFQSLKEPSGLWKAVWEAFDISIVNKKFYAEIKEVFDLLVKEELPKSKGVLLHDEERVQFAIRLIGRVIFCWFLKRKGIIADDVLSAKAVKSNSNYYHDILERLFFDVFNTPRDERKGDLPASIKDYPFLNGGLFDPQHEDHKGSWALNIGNDWFIRFFGNTLERYNFTVDENSAASSEIAIDPEMLGRIFENLLAEQNPDTGESARKSTGSFYTPREIVDFMVEESLIAYLNANVGAYCNTPLPADAIEEFVRTGILPDALKPYTKDLLRLLDAIKVLDPASGSGAFPISMLQKIVGLKHLLDTQSSLYELKLRTIENSIYGVDIQPMATELSRLRCWLSLIVDEDPKDIKPLPNLDFKFITANSLIDLGYDEFLQKVETGKIPGMFLTGFIKKMDELRDVRKRYFEATVSKGEKDRLKKEFNAIQSNLLKMSLELIKQKFIDAEFSNKITGWDPFDDSKPAPFFNKSWMFGVEEGFDVVIANPPYIGEANHKDIFEPLKKTSLGNRFYTGKMDIYYFFFHLAIDLSKDSGFVYFITTNYYTTAYGAKKLRKDFKERTTVCSLTDFNELKVFESARGQHNMLSFLRKGKYDSDVLYCRTKRKGYANAEILSTILNRTDSETEYSTFKQKDVFHSEDNLIGISRNEDNLVESLLLKIEKQGDYKFANNEIASGIDVLQEAVVKNHLKEMPLLRVGEGIFVLTSDELNQLGLSQNEMSIIRPFYTTSEIIKYGACSRNKKWLIYTTTETIKHIDDYPNIKLHLDKFSKLMTSDNKPYGLHRARDEKFFKRAKILCLRMTREPLFSLVENDSYVARPFLIIQPNGNGLNLKYLVSLLNSKLFCFWFYHRGKRKGEQLQIDKDSMLRVLIKKIPEIQQQSFISLVDQILAAKQKDPKADTSALEKQIDEMVYKLYALTPEEIAVVEGIKNDVLPH